MHAAQADGYTAASQSYTFTQTAPVTSQKEQDGAPAVGNMFMYTCK